MSVANLFNSGGTYIGSAAIQNELTAFQVLVELRLH